MGGCLPSLWHRFQRCTLSGERFDFVRWVPPGSRLLFTQRVHLMGSRVPNPRHELHFPCVQCGGQGGASLARAPPARGLHRGSAAHCSLCPVLMSEPSTVPLAPARRETRLCATAPPRRKNRNWHFCAHVPSFMMTLYLQPPPRRPEKGWGLLGAQTAQHRAPRRQPLYIRYYN